MPDLWKALGDVYGNADGPPVPREPAASDRGADEPRYGAPLPLDDDLAAALSAALVNAPTPGGPAVPGAPVAPGVPGAPVAPPAPAGGYQYASAAPAPSPVAPPPVYTPPPAAYTAPGPAAAAPAAPQATERVSTWIAEIDERNRRRDEGPDLAGAQFPTWSRSDDDILPAGVKRRRSKK